jgi:pilus assembly protein CpaB
MATFVVALLIATATSFFVFQKLKQSTVKASTTTRVVMAARDLEIGTKVAESDLKIADWAGASPAGAFSKTGDLVGRALIYPVFQNEMLLDAKLAPIGSGAGLPAVIPSGMRAVSIRVDDVVAVAGFVGPGTRVDVLLTGNPGKSGGDSSLTKTILQNVQVLAAGQKIQPDEQGRAEKVNVVTLLCNPEDAAKVTLAANEGRIQLVLRNPTDTTHPDKEATVGRQALYGGQGQNSGSDAPKVARKAPRPAPQVAALPPAPVPPPPPIVVKTIVEVVRGEKVSQVEFTTPAGQATGTQQQ